MIDTSNVILNTSASRKAHNGFSTSVRYCTAQVQKQNWGLGNITVASLYIQQRSFKCHANIKYWFSQHLYLIITWMDDILIYEAIHTQK